MGYAAERHFETFNLFINVFFAFQSLFPAHLPTSQVVAMESESKPSSSEDKDAKSSSLVMDLSQSIGALLSNSTFMLISVGAALDGFLLAGKNFEKARHFKVTIHLLFFCN